MKMLKYSFLGLALAVGASAAAHADPWRHYDLPKPQPLPMPERKVAPEIDPSLAISGMLLLGGSLAVLRARRRK
jgi:LPXTG-motif cell wall-anchored protein